MRSKLVAVLAGFVAPIVLLGIFGHYGCSTKVRRLYWNGVRAMQVGNENFRELQIKPKYLASSLTVSLPDGERLSSNEFNRTRLTQLYDQNIAQKRFLFTLEPYGDPNNDLREWGVTNHLKCFSDLLLG